MSTSDRRLFKLLPPVPRKKILGYIQDPTWEGWRTVRDIIVAPGLKLYEATFVLDKTKSEMYPSSITVARASKLAERRNADLKAMEI